VAEAISSALCDVCRKAVESGTVFHDPCLADFSRTIERAVWEAAAALIAAEEVTLPTRVREADYIRGSLAELLIRASTQGVTP